jgi:hypothetical protein
MHLSQGITPHVDLHRFEDGICSVSFGDPAIMQFQRAHGEERHQVLLRGGDLLTMHSEARWQWKHGLEAVPQELFRIGAQGSLPPTVDLDPGPSSEGPSSVDPPLDPPQCPSLEGRAAPQPRLRAVEGGVVVERGTRLSVTLRRLSEGIVLSG